MVSFDLFLPLHETSTCGCAVRLSQQCTPCAARVCFDIHLHWLKTFGSFSGSTWTRRCDTMGFVYSALGRSVASLILRVDVLQWKTMCCSAMPRCTRRRDCWYTPESGTQCNVLHRRLIPSAVTICQHPCQDLIGPAWLMRFVSPLLAFRERNPVCATRHRLASATSNVVVHQCRAAPRVHATTTLTTAACAILSLAGSVLSWLASASDALRLRPRCCSCLADAVEQIVQRCGLRRITRFTACRLATTRL